MIKFLFKVTLFLTIFQSGYGQIRVTGHVNGLNNDTIIILSDYLGIGNLKTDTVLVVNGNFQYSTNIAKTNVAALVLKSPNDPTGMTSRIEFPPIFIVLTNKDQIGISAEIMKDSISYEIDSSLPLNQELRMQYYSLLNNGIKRSKIRRQIHLSSDNKEKERLNKEYLSLMDESDKTKRQFIKSNPDKEISAMYSIIALPQYYIESYNLLSDRVRNGIFKDLLNEKLIRVKKFLRVYKSDTVVPKSNAPMFTLKDLKGKNVSLSDFKGKFVILDFWGTWCGPCIEGLPKMKIYHQKYGGKIEFISIACNDKKDKVASLVQTEGLNWTQLINKSPEDVQLKYDIYLFPTKFIISNDGTIIDIFYGETYDFYYKLDQLFGKN